MKNLTGQLQSNKRNIKGGFALVKTDVPGLYVVTRTCDASELLDPNVNDYIRWTKSVPHSMLSSAGKGVNSIRSIMSPQCNEFVLLQLDENATGKFPYNFTFMTFYNK